METKKVSIIVPVYNVEPYLTRCLDSLMTQDYPNIEIIAVNDGSTDNGLGILKQYQTQYPNILLLDQANGGLSLARNNGFKLSTGDYIFFIDSDDYLLPGSISALVTALTDDIDIVELPLFDTTDTSQQPAAYQTPSTINGVDLTQQPATLFQIAIYACAKLYRRTMIENLPFPKGLAHEDNYLATCLLPRLRKVHKVDKGGYCYYRRTTSITNVYNTNMYDMIQIQKLIHQTYEEKGYLDQYHYFCEKMAIRNMVVAILGKKMALIKPELRHTRKEAYHAIRDFIKHRYSRWNHNPYVTSKEKLFVSFLMLGYPAAQLIWKRGSHHE